MENHRKIIQNKNDLKKLIRYCKQTGYCCFDFETSGKPYWWDDETESYPTVLSVTFQPGSSWILPLGHSSSPFKDNYIEVLKYFGKHVLENPSVTKIAWNLQFELNWCKRYNIFPNGRLFDAMLAKYLLDETRPNDLKSMVNRFIPEFANYDDEIDQLVKKHGWADLPFEPLCKYAGIDSDMEMRLWVKFEPLLIEKGLYPLFRNLLMMAVRVLSDSSYYGVHVDEKRLKELEGEYEQKIKNTEDKMRSEKKFMKYEKNRIKRIKNDYMNSIQDEIDEMKSQMEETGDNRELTSLSRKIANRETKLANFALGNITNKKEQSLGDPFNFGSPTQLKDLLFLSKKGFQFDVVKYTEDKWGNETDNPSTAEDVLLKLKEKYDSSFMDLMLEYRGLKHIKSNFIDSYLEKIHKGKLHPSFLLHGTVSGRLSSKDPNAQQIPRITTNPDIKPLFKPSPGKVIMQVDYSQCELRVMASMAKETEMMRWFAEGRDIHLSSACKKYNFDYDEALKILKEGDHPENETWVKRRKQAKCYSPDTEVLTISGWQRLDSYNGGKVAQYDFNSEEISFTEPENYGKVISENNYTYEDRNISLDITEDHKTLLITRAGVKIKDDFKKLVGKNGYMPNAGFYKADYSIGDDFTRFIAMFTADGNINGDGKIRFGFTKLLKIKRCRELLDRLGVIYTKPKEGKFYIPLKPNLPLYNKLKKYVWKDKKLSWDALNDLNGKVYLDEAQYWDSNINDKFKEKRVSFSTVIEQTADVMQAMGTINGIRVIKYTQDLKDGRTRYVLSYRPDGKTMSRVNLKKAKFYKVEGGKDMWSITVPKRNLVTRKNGKVVLSGNTINFGIIYGQGAHHLSETLSSPGNPISKEQAQRFLDDFFRDFPRVKNFIKNQHKKAKKYGFVSSPFGRKRRLPEIHSYNWAKKAEAERQSVNAVIQGCASDYTLFSSILIWEMIKSEELPEGMVQLITVHDSLIYELYPEDIHYVVNKIKPVMENPETKRWFGFELKGITMAVDFEIGDNWGTLKEYKPDFDYTTLIK